MAMKMTYTVLLFLLLLPRIWGADQVSIEEFKKITNEDDRRMIIAKAPPDQKAELKQIDLHMALLARWGGDAGFRAHKESFVARARGLGALEFIFGFQVDLWGSYFAGLTAANEKAGMTNGQQEEAEKRITEEEAAFHKRFENVHSLVFNMAASPEALALSKEAGELGDKLSERFSRNGSNPVTKDELTQINKQMAQIFDEMSKLPKLTPEQLQKEYDSVTDEQVAQW
jgi:hypothetical protein